ncbi:MAG TPA: hypothetical protein VLH56_07400 [Dissulfurispiraceae bacterium]|nr:hypothetical protein [Dissulfurispiraceae bacterium]
MNEDKKPVCVWRYQKSQSFEGYHVYEPECDRGLGVNCQKKKENGEIDNKCGRPIEIQGDDV